MNDGSAKPKSEVFQPRTATANQVHQKNYKSTFCQRQKLNLRRQRSLINLHDDGEQKSLLSK